MKVSFSDTCYETWEKNGVSVVRLSQEEAAAFLGDYYTPVRKGIEEKCTDKGLALIKAIEDWQAAR